MHEWVFAEISGRIALLFVGAIETRKEAVSVIDADKNIGIGVLLGG